MPSEIAYANVVDHLVECVPEFGDVLVEHLRDYDRLVEHVLCGDLTRFVLRARQDGDQDVVRRTLTFLDEALRHGDERTENLVAVSFVENVGPWDPEQATFIAEWPQALRDEATRQRDWRPDGG